MRKLLGFFVVVLFAAGGAGLFANGQPEKGTSTPAAAKKDMVWYVWDDPVSQGYNTIAGEYTKEHPNINISVSRTPFARYEETIRTILAGGDQPNVIEVNDDFVPLYSHNGWLTALKDFDAKLGIKRDDTYVTYWDFNYWKGTRYTVTPVIKFRLHLYNKDLFDQAGLQEPPADWGNPNWTWDTALQDAEKMTKKEGNRTTVYGWSVDQDVGAASIWLDNAIAGRNDIYSGDGTKFMGATPAGWEAMQFLADLSYKYGVQPPWGTNQNGSNTLNMYYSGNVALILDGTYDIEAAQTNNRFKWNIAPNPGKVEDHTMASLVCFGIPTGAKDRPEAEDFLAYLMGRFTAKTWAEVGYGIPVVKSYAADYYQVPAGIRKQTALGGLAAGFPPVFTVNTGKAKPLFDAAYKMVYSGEKPAKDVMMGVSAQIDEALNSK